MSESKLEPKFTLEKYNRWEQDHFRHKFKAAVDTLSQKSDSLPLGGLSGTLRPHEGGVTPLSSFQNILKTINHLNQNQRSQCIHV